jgi:hypothetical protein
MNWGAKIAIVYCTFAAGIGYMAFRAANQNFDLVTPDYYAEELKHQSRIDAVDNANALSSSLRYQISSNEILLTFPKECISKDLHGVVKLYCASDAQKDIQRSFTLSDSLYTFKLPSDAKGSREIQVTWYANGKEFYYSKKVNL